MFFSAVCYIHTFSYFLSHLLPIYPHPFSASFTLYVIDGMYRIVLTIGTGLCRALSTQFQSTAQHLKNVNESFFLNYLLSYTRCSPKFIQKSISALESRASISQVSHIQTLQSGTRQLNCAVFGLKFPDFVLMAQRNLKREAEPYEGEYDDEEFEDGEFEDYDLAGKKWYDLDATRLSDDGEGWIRLNSGDSDIGEAEEGEELDAGVPPEK
ncbi:hypothetical protein CEUSTIGMA_g7565.t1 [Chlamydomonas eustigma]|uniref:Uncharacterized protein n=1 Tax=Chlamydomonas eustigma TaxID=1157962 RepID=A0A250XAM5_9CHLO|nr:hypothetical protein CEUSTIGMA_g7565.t1 [Chlamydomonas eustigma]|eukprot:GAX80127.1 hypothetical protein CEUSTIGMA_g7565.t1 [Chlamydomonas eustigma]